MFSLTINDNAIVVKGGFTKILSIAWHIDWYDWLIFERKESWFKPRSESFKSLTIDYAKLLKVQFLKRIHFVHENLAKFTNWSRYLGLKYSSSRIDFLAMLEKNLNRVIFSYILKCLQMYTKEIEAATLLRRSSRIRICKTIASCRLS